MLGFFYFKLFFLSSRCKKANIFQLFSLNSHQGSAMNLSRKLQHLQTPTCVLQWFGDRFSWNRTFENWIFVPKRTLVKLPEDGFKLNGVYTNFLLIPSDQCFGHQKTIVLKFTDVFRRKGKRILSWSYFTILHIILPRFGILELRNRVVQNDVTLWVTNSKRFIEILFSSY